MITNCTICSKKCLGYEGNHGGCCSAYNNWILGAVKDEEEFLKNLSMKFGREVKREEVLIDFEEGKKLFPNKQSWQNPNNYPAIKVNTEDPAKYCIFYNKTIRACGIYEIRPSMCRKYECDYLKQHG